MKKLVLIAILSTTLVNAPIAQTTTVGLLQYNNPADDGYILFAPLDTNITYLIDKCGKKVHSWNSAYKPGSAVYLLADGDLLRAGNVNNNAFSKGGSGGIIERIDWDGNVKWSYTISDNKECMHHDMSILPNGNILVIAWEKKTLSEAIAAGGNPAMIQSSVWSEQILELQPVGTNGANIVWEWHLWDHLVQDHDNTKPNFGTIATSPGLMNLNYSETPRPKDWIHLNSIEYNPALDQIMLSTKDISEIWVIDHSTSTLQAAGHNGGNAGKGGDFLYRYGNPAAYNNGTEENQVFFGQHNAHWIAPGLPFENDIMVFNNGNGRTGGNYSSVEIITPPTVSAGIYNSTLPYGPSASTWSYTDATPSNFFAPLVSGAQQLANGNVLICEGTSGNFFEIDNNKNTVWKYINPIADTGILLQGTVPVDNDAFRAVFYPSSYSGLSGKTLTGISTIENINTISDGCGITLISIANAAESEGNAGTKQLSFPVSLSSPSLNTITVKYRTENGIAVSPADFIAANGTIVFNPGETTKMVNITINGDLTPEGNETFKVKLSRPVNAILAVNKSTGTISNDDIVSVSLAGGSQEAFVAGNNNNIKIYPNPVIDKVNILLPDNSSGHTIVITDIAGRSIKKAISTANQKSITLNVDELSKGVYMVKIISANQSNCYKFIKQ